MVTKADVQAFMAERSEYTKANRFEDIEVKVGVVAMVAMTPLITVQLMGLVAQLKTRKARSAQPLLDPAALLAELPDDAIIEL